MCVQPINNLSRSTLQLRTSGFNGSSIKSIQALQKIASDRGINIFISKAKDNARNRDLIMALAYKEDILERSVASSFVNNNGTPEELSVKVYNTAMMAIEYLQKKII